MPESGRFPILIDGEFSSNHYWICNLNASAPSGFSEEFHKKVACSRLPATIGLLSSNREFIVVTFDGGMSKHDRLGTIWGPNHGRSDITFQFNKSDYGTKVFIRVDEEQELKKEQRESIVGLVKYFIQNNLSINELNVVKAVYGERCELAEGIFSGGIHRLEEILKEEN